MTCNRCGAVITPGPKFCPACGNALPPEPVLPATSQPVSAAGPLPGYAPPVSTSQPAVARSTNGLAIAAMVLGIVWVYWVGSILALVFGYVAKGQIDQSGGRQGGKGMAIAGIVLGWVGIGTLVLCIVAFAVAPKH